MADLGTHLRSGIAVALPEPVQQDPATVDAAELSVA